MSTDTAVTWIAFAGTKRIALGVPRDVAQKVKAWVDSESQAMVLVFDVATSRPVELDLRGPVSTVLDRLPVEDQVHVDASANTPRPAGRPKLGVTAREVTLLPRHWNWLASQPGGASVALRKLVEHAIQANRTNDRVREAREAAYRFMNAIAGNEPGFEEAVRSLFAGDHDGLRQAVARWPVDVREHAIVLADASAHGNLELECGAP